MSSVRHVDEGANRGCPLAVDDGGREGRSLVGRSLFPRVPRDSPATSRLSDSSLAHPRARRHRGPDGSFASPRHGRYQSHRLAAIGSASVSVHEPVDDSDNEPVCGRLRNVSLTRVESFRTRVNRVCEPPDGLTREHSTERSVFVSKTKRK